MRGEKRGRDGRRAEGMVKVLKGKGLRVGVKMRWREGLRVEGEDVPKERGR